MSGLIMLGAIILGITVLGVIFSIGVSFSRGRGEEKSVDDTYGLCIHRGVAYSMPSKIRIDPKSKGLVAFHPETQVIKVFKTRAEVTDDWVLLAEVK